MLTITVLLSMMSDFIYKQILSMLDLNIRIINANFAMDFYVIKIVFLDRFSLARRAH